jgi:Tol biopolymer transport system component
MLPVVAAVAVAVAVPMAYLLRRPVEAPSTRFLITPPENSTLALVNVAGPISVSPDGRQVAFVASGGDGKNYLWIRSLDSLSSRMLSRTDDPAYPFWSPDSRSIGFFAGGKLNRVATSGGPPQILCDAPSGRGGSWNRKDEILFSPTPVSGLYRVAATGGQPAVVTRLDASRSESGHTWPQFLPDGQRFLYYVFTGQQESSGIYVGSLHSNERRHLLTAKSNAAYLPPRSRGPGLLLFAQGATLMAQPFDADQLQVSGVPSPVAEGVGYYEGFRIADFSVSQNAVLAYGSGIVYPLTQLIWFTREGKQLGSVGTPGHHTVPRLSPDQKKLAVGRMDVETAAKVVWLMDVAGISGSRFTLDPSSTDYPVWSPDGSQIVFATARDGPFNLYRKPAAGGEEEPLLKSEDFKLPTDWSRDGSSILFHGLGVTHANPNWDLWILPLKGGRKPYRLTQSRFNEQAGRFSPDGQWIAYVSDESGRYEVYVQPFSGEHSERRGRWQISTSGGTAPKWRHDGKELFYTAADGKLTSVEVQPTASTFVVGALKVLFTPPGPYDVAAGGDRFLVNVRVGHQLPSPITVVLNWSPELRR